MKKITQSNEKLMKYTAMAGTFLAGSAVNAQVQYVDINPDATITKSNSPYLLDMNNDASDDLQFVVNSMSGSFTYSGFNIVYSGSYAAVGAASLGGVMGTSGTSNPAASALSNGNAIDAAANFIAAGQLGMAGSYSIVGLPYGGPFSSGNFQGAGEKFLGVKLSISGNDHFGWVRLELSADAGTLTIKDYAYLGGAGGQILAGQTVGLDHIAVEDKVTFKVTPSEAVVNVTPDLIGGELSLVDLNGRTLSTVAITDINTTMTFNDSTTGVYLLVASFNNGSVSKKVYVK